MNNNSRGKKRNKHNFCKIIVINFIGEAFNFFCFTASGCPLLVTVMIVMVIIAIKVDGMYLSMFI